MHDLSPQERLGRVFARESVDRPPVLCTGGMMNAAVVEVMGAGAPQLPAAHFSAEGMADLSAAIHRATGFENLGVPFCMTVEAEVLGSRIDPGTLACEPKIAAELYKHCADVEVQDVQKLLGTGRIGTVVEAARLLKLRHGDVPIIASLTGPVSTAASVVDPLTFLKELRTRPAEAHRTMDYVTRLLTEYALAVLDNGADVICIGDPTATGEILGPKVFQDFAVRYINQMIDAIHAVGKPVIVHICGDMSRSRNQLAELRTDAISTDALVNLRGLKAEFPHLNTMGNVSTQLLEFGEAEKVARVTERLVRDGIDIISPACGLSTSTSLTNIRAVTDTVRNGVAYAEGTR
jgi:MtaA/CmuA family methyltransferase